MLARFFIFVFCTFFVVDDLNSQGDVYKYNENQSVYDYNSNKKQNNKKASSGTDSCNNTQDSCINTSGKNKNTKKTKHSSKKRKSETERKARRADRENTAPVPVVTEDTQTDENNSEITPKASTSGFSASGAGEELSWGAPETASETGKKNNQDKSSSGFGSLFDAIGKSNFIQSIKNTFSGDDEDDVSSEELADSARERRENIAVLLEQDKARFATACTREQSEAEKKAIKSRFKLALGYPANESSCSRITNSEECGEIVYAPYNENCRAGDTVCQYYKDLPYPVSACRYEGGKCHSEGIRNCNYPFFYDERADAKIHEIYLNYENLDNEIYIYGSDKKVKADKILDEFKSQLGKGSEIQDYFYNDIFGKQVERKDLAGKFQYLKAGQKEDMLNDPNKPYIKIGILPASKFEINMIDKDESILKCISSFERNTASGNPLLDKHAFVVVEVHQNANSDQTHRYIYHGSGTFDRVIKNKNSGKFQVKGLKRKRIEANNGFEENTDKNSETENKKPKGIKKKVLDNFTVAYCLDVGIRGDGTAFTDMEIPLYASLNFHDLNPQRYLGVRWQKFGELDGDDYYWPKNAEYWAEAVEDGNSVCLGYLRDLVSNVNAERTKIEELSQIVKNRINRFSEIYKNHDNKNEMKKILSKIGGLPAYVSSEMEDTFYNKIYKHYNPGRNDFGELENFITQRQSQLLKDEMSKKTPCNDTSKPEFKVNGLMNYKFVAARLKLDQAYFGDKDRGYWLTARESDFNTDNRAGDIVSENYINRMLAQSIHIQNFLDSYLINLYDIQISTDTLDKDYVSEYEKTYAKEKSKAKKKSKWKLDDTMKSINMFVGGIEAGFKTWLDWYMWKEEMAFQKKMAMMDECEKSLGDSEEMKNMNVPWLNLDGITTEEISVMEACYRNLFNLAQGNPNEQQQCWKLWESGFITTRRQMLQCMSVPIDPKNEHELPKVAYDSNYQNGVGDNLPAGTTKKDDDEKKDEAAAAASAPAAGALGGSGAAAPSAQNTQEGRPRSPIDTRYGGRGFGLKGGADFDRTKNSLRGGSAGVLNNKVKQNLEEREKTLGNEKSAFWDQKTAHSSLYLNSSLVKLGEELPVKKNSIKKRIKRSLKGG